MDYKLKHLREDELSKFLLNPFQKSAYLNNRIIQKYPINESVDDIICISEVEKDFCRTGVVIYANNEIILESQSFFGTDVVNSKPFNIIDNLKEPTTELVRKMLQKSKVEKLEEIKKMELYKRVYEYRTERYFDSFVFTELGTIPISLDHSNQIDRKIKQFIDGLMLDDYIEISLGSMHVIDKFLDSFIKSELFIEIEIVDPQIIKDAKDYVAAGKFNKRELILIDYLDKTKASKANRFEIETTEGRRASCYNCINYYGKVFSTDGLSFVVDVEDIDSVKCGGNLIYKKSIH